MESLRKEIDKRDYRNIEGLKCEISFKEFDYFLNVLYPLNWITEKKGNVDQSFLLNECLTENLYYKFSEIKTEKGFKYYCEVVRYKSFLEVEKEIYG